MLTMFKLIVISSAMASIIFAVIKLAEKLFVRSSLSAKSLVLYFPMLFQLSVILLSLFCREVKPTKLEKQRSIIITTIEMLDTDTVNPAVSRMEYIAHKINILQILLYIWLFAASAFVLLNVFRYFKFRNTLKKSFIREINNDISELRIFSSGIVSSPFLIGVFKPVIVVPEMKFSESELSMTVRHETIHFRRHDIIKKLAMNFFRCINWFNPVFYILEKQAGEISEFIADEILTANAEYSERKAYGNLLLKFAESEACAAGMYSRLSGNALRLAKRLELIMKSSPRKKLNKAAVIIGAAAATAVIGVSVNAMVGMVPKDTASDTIPPDKVIEFRPLEQQPAEGFSMINVYGTQCSWDIMTNSKEMFLFPEDMYEFDVQNNNNGYAVENLAYNHNQVIIICNEDGNGIWLDEDQKCTVKIMPANINDKGAGLSVGYIYNNEGIEFYSDRAYTAQELSVEFTSEKAGEYKFYIRNECAGLQHYEYITIEKEY